VKFFWALSKHTVLRHITWLTSFSNLIGWFRHHATSLSFSTNHVREWFSGSSGGSVDRFRRNTEYFPLLFVFIRLKASSFLISLAVCHNEDVVRSNKYVLIRSEGRGSVGIWEAVSSTHCFHLLAFGESTKLITLRLTIKMIRLYSNHQVLCDRRDAINETAGFTYCFIPGVCKLYYWRTKPN